MSNRGWPDANQQKLCQILDLPFSLWTFYVLKKYVIQMYWENYNDHTHPYEHEIYPSNKDQWIESDPKSLTSNLTKDELFFYRHHKFIQHLQEHYICFVLCPSTLQDMCVEKIVQTQPQIETNENPYFQKLMGLYIRTVPKLNFQEIKYDVKKQYDLFSRYFSNVDQTFTIRCVRWFQNNVLDYKVNPDVNIVTFHFKIKGLTDRFFDPLKYYCMRCMKNYRREHNMNGPFDRYFRKLNCPLSEFVRIRPNWCWNCKRVPLFQILTSEQYYDKYGHFSADNPIKLERYI